MLLPAIMPGTDQDYNYRDDDSDDKYDGGDSVMSRISLIVIALSIAGIGFMSKR